MDRIADDCRRDARRVATACGSGRDPVEDEYDYQYVRGELGYPRHEWGSNKPGEQFPSETVTKVRY